MVSPVWAGAARGAGTGGGAPEGWVAGLGRGLGSAVVGTAGTAQPIGGGAPAEIEARCSVNRIMVLLLPK